MSNYTMNYMWTEITGIQLQVSHCAILSQVLIAGYINRKNVCISERDDNEITSRA